MTLYLDDGTPLRLTDLVEVGQGRQAKVFGQANDDAACFKIFLEPTSEMDRRIGALLRLGRTSEVFTDAAFAWPRWGVRDERGSFRGVVLSRIRAQSLHAMFMPRARTEALDVPTWKTIVQIAARVANLFARLHNEKVVIGDVSPGNLMVSRNGWVTLIDCDSVQFTENEAFYAAGHITPEYASPESLSGSQTLTQMHDLFGLGILICQLLMEGVHPFEGLPVSGPDNGTHGNIVAGNHRLASPRRLRPVDGLLDPSVLPREVAKLARTCFVDGHRQPSARPLAKEWATTLDREAQSLNESCGHPNHAYSRSLSECIWCWRRQAGYGEHYPASSTSDSDDDDGWRSGPGETGGHVPESRSRSARHRPQGFWNMMGTVQHRPKWGTS
jgi:DNA-binding helix-hairpin-helix protein with protein kinase domain